MLLGILRGKIELQPGDFPGYIHEKLHFIPDDCESMRRVWTLS